MDDHRTKRYASTVPPIAPGPDIALITPVTTFGWRYADSSFAAMLEQGGYSVDVRPIEVGAAARLRRTMAMTDLVEALGARRAARRTTARVVIYSSITAALLQPAARPYAVRFDTVAAQSRPGVSGAWQRAREPGVLARARLLLPWSELAGQGAAELIARKLNAPEAIVLPPPIERHARVSVREPLAVAYAANPLKRGLEILCAAWAAAAPAGVRLLVAGIDRDRALSYLAGTGVAAPPGIEWAGDLPHEVWIEHVASARIYVNASRFEDWGIGQLEALSAGTPLVTVPSSGPNQALRIARTLTPSLVAPAIDAGALASMITAGLSLTPAELDAYARAANAALEPYRREAVRRTILERVLPALFATSSA